jgi:hypothetical protein
MESSHRTIPTILFATGIVDEILFKIDRADHGQSDPSLKISNNDFAGAQATPRKVDTIQKRSLTIQTENHKSQQKRDTIAETQYMALEFALRAERIRSVEQDVKVGMHDIQNLTKDHSLLKQKFVKHCKKHTHQRRLKDSTQNKSGENCCSWRRTVFTYLTISIGHGKLTVVHWWPNRHHDFPQMAKPQSSRNWQRILCKFQQLLASCKRALTVFISSINGACESKVSSESLSLLSPQAAILS